MTVAIWNIDSGNVIAEVETLEEAITILSRHVKEAWPGDKPSDHFFFDMWADEDSELGGIDGQDLDDLLSGALTVDQLSERRP